MTFARSLLALCALVAFSSEVFASKKDRDAATTVEHAKQLSDIRAEGTAPFQMRMNFKLRHEDGTFADGVYSEYWVSNAQWRREIVVGDFRRIEVANGRKRWLLDSSSPPPEHIAELPGLSETNRSPGPWKFWKDIEFHGISVQCFQNKTAVSPARLALCFDKAKGTLMIEVKPSQSGSGVSERLCAYSDYEGFGEHTLARSYECDEGKQIVLQARISELTLVNSRDEALFLQPAGAKESVNCLTSVQPPKPISMPEPMAPTTFHGSILVAMGLMVGTDGRPHDLKVISAPRKDFDDAAMKAVRQWSFRPANCGGEPMEVQIAVEVEFHM